MIVLLSASSSSYEDSSRILTDSLAYSLLVPSLIEPELGATEHDDFQDFLEWSQPGSNRRPPACKAGALPTELWPRVGRVYARGAELGGSMPRAEERRAGATLEYSRGAPQTLDTG